MLLGDVQVACFSMSVTPLYPPWIWTLVKKLWHFLKCRSISLSPSCLGCSCFFCVLLLSQLLDGWARSEHDFCPYLSILWRVGDVRCHCTCCRISIVTVIVVGCRISASKADIIIIQIAIAITCTILALIGHLTSWALNMRLVIVLLKAKETCSQPSSHFSNQKKKETPTPKTAVICSLVCAMRNILWL